MELFHLSIRLLWAASHPNHYGSQFQAMNHLLQITLQITNNNRESFKTNVYDLQIFLSQYEIQTQTQTIENYYQNDSKFNDKTVFNTFIIQSKINHSGNHLWHLLLSSSLFSFKCFHWSVKRTFEEFWCKSFHWIRTLFNSYRDWRKTKSFSRIFLFKT